ncbi:MAG: tetratricopeptide repeat protein, partial [Spirochaetota bacterium]
TAHEENSEPEEAMDAYRQLLSMRPDSSPLTARALFSLGRLSERQSGDGDDPRDYYERIINEYPQSNWTTLARNRLLALSTAAP